MSDNDKSQIEQLLKKVDELNEDQQVECITESITSALMTLFKLGYRGNKVAKAICDEFSHGDNIILVDQRNVSKLFDILREMEQIVSTTAKAIKEALEIKLAKKDYSDEHKN